ncbi:hypothetical protein GGI07_001008 [Coemansia sp. Benny D115]|nr:hypothetical protein GGI07_001008 [Coemansia sp. Benny D115]
MRSAYKQPRANGRRHSHTKTPGDDETEKGGLERWSRAISYEEAAKLVAGQEEAAQGSIGRVMPSSVMRRLDMSFYGDVRRRRQRHGRRAEILAALSDLRQLIASSSGPDDKTGSVFRKLGELETLYTQILATSGDRWKLQLRSGTSVTLGTVTIALGMGTQPQAAAQTVEYRPSDHGPMLLPCGELGKKKQKQAQMSVDPMAPNWIDYLVADLDHAEARRLYALVARSRVPEGAASMLRTSAEEALAFAFNRRAQPLDVLPALRVCMCFLRQGACTPAQIQQLQRVWLWAGHQLADAPADDTGDLWLKRWCDVASQILASLAAYPAGVPEAWRVLARWHALWTRRMRQICPEPRRQSLAQNDGLGYPYWRPNAPGRMRLHTLTLSTPAITQLLSALMRDGHVQNALALLGLATSEIGVRLSPSVFNVALGGLARLATGRAHLDGVGYALPELSQMLPELSNQRAPRAYCLPDDHGEWRLLDHMAVLLHAMQRWRQLPDARTMEIVVGLCCCAADPQALRAALRLFAMSWRVRPSEWCWQTIEDYGMLEGVREFYADTVEPLFVENMQ